MKVGIFFPGFDPSSGGGHTFEQEILQAVLELSVDSRHELILYFEIDSVKKTLSLSLPSAKNLCSKWLIQPITAPQKNLLVKAIKKLISKQEEASHKTSLHAAVERDNIHLVWFPTGIYSPVEIPYIATIWDIQHRIQPWFPEVSQNGQWQGRENYYANFLRRASFIITPNQTGQNELSLSYDIPAERFRRLPHPAPRIKHIPSQEEVVLVLNKYKLVGRYLFYPAQFWAHKNHVNLLKALKILRDIYKLDFDLVLVGSDQGNLQHIQSMAEEFHLDNVVHFLGFVPRQDLIALYKGAFALTYVTYFGPENLPPLEAFACGCPVIASSVAGAVEQFGDAALLVDPSSPMEIAQMIKNLDDEPILRANLIAKGHMRSKKYTGIDYVRDVFKILDDFEPIRVNWP